MRFTKAVALFTLAVITAGVANGARANQTTRIAQLLGATDGQKAFYVKQVGGGVVGKLGESLAYDPASSIKILVAVGVMKRVDAGKAHLGTTARYFSNGLVGSCPFNTGPSQRLTLGTLISLMLVFSDNAATRSLIDLLGGFSAVNQLAASIGMASTNMNVYPGCNITNTMTQLDGARLYEGLANGTLLSATSRSALYARMPANGGDSTGTFSQASQIVDSLAPAYDLDAAQIAQFKAGLALHYKAGNDTWCTPDCKFYLAISGNAVLPTCTGSSVSATRYVWGLSIADATNESAAFSTFFSTHPETLREPLQSSLAGWSACSPACVLPSAVSGLPTWTAGTSYSLGTNVQWQGMPYKCMQPTCVAQAGSEPDRPGLTSVWQGVALCGLEPWAAAVAYPAGHVVLSNGKRYRCITGHLSATTWPPEATPSLWQEQL